MLRMPTPAKSLAATFPMEHPPSLAVLVPFFNEQQFVDWVCAELREVLKADAIDAEVILLDDGSTDKTGEKLDGIAASWPECRVFHLGENRGQSAALLFGFAKSSSRLLATMDGDGQNDPRDILHLLATLGEADMVVGQRFDRKDSWIRRQISKVANLVRSSALGDGVSDAGCALKVFRREVVEAFIPIRTLYSFMPALAVAAGFQVIEQPVNHRARAGGKSKYSVKSFLWWPIIDFIGVSWFRFRRCRTGIRYSANSWKAEVDLGDELYRRVAMRWLKIVTSVVLLTLSVGSVLFFSWHLSPTGPSDRKIGLKRAERIALHYVPKGQLRTEELRMEGGRLAWLIDVQPADSVFLNEVEIDAKTGRVIGSHTESPDEERLELAAEDQSLDPSLLKPHK